MNLTRDSAVALAEAVASKAARTDGVELLVCPPSVYLDAVREAIAGRPLGLGAQNVYHEPSGAFTGEVSVSMLADLGCRYVILGHSERRHVLGETDAEVNQKLLASLAGGLIPILCVGELLADREAGRTGEVIRSQFEKSCAGLSSEQIAQTVIAYEPVWAIGTGRVATDQQAEETHLDLRRIIESRYNADVAATVRILYGGSVKPANAAGLMAQPNVDGALVGGASLKADDFVGIVDAVAG